MKRRPRLLRLILCFGLGLHLVLAWGEISHSADGQAPHVLGQQRMLNPELPGSRPIQRDGVAIAQSSPPLQTGINFFNAGQYTQAIQAWQTTLESSPPDDHQALVFNYLAAAYQALGQWHQASQALHQSLTLLRTSEPSGARAQIHARILTTQARLDLSRGRPQDALQSLQQAKHLYQQLEDAQGLLGTQINAAQALISLGRYRPALKQLQQIKDHLDQQPPSLAVLGSLSIGTVYQSMGDLSAAWCELEAGLALAQAKGLTALEPEFKLSLGNIALALGQRDQIRLHPAIPQRQPQSFLPFESLQNHPQGACHYTPASGMAQQFYQDAQQYYGEVAQQATAPPLQRTAQLHQLEAQLYRLELSQAQGKPLPIEDFGPILDLWQQLEHQFNPSQLPQIPSRTEVWGLIQFANHSLRLHRQLALSTTSATGPPVLLSLPRIKRLLESAILRAHQLQDPQAQSLAHGTLGHFYEEHGQWSQALAATQIALRQTADQPAHHYQWQWQLGRIYKALGDQPAALESYQAALNTLQTVRPTLHTLGSPFGLSPEQPDLNIDFQYYFRDRVEPIYREYMDLLLAAPEPPAPEPPLKKNALTHGLPTPNQRLLSALATYELFQESELETLLGCHLKSSLNGTSPRSPLPLQQTVADTTQQIREKLDQIHLRTPHTAILFPIELADRIEIILSIQGQPLIHGELAQQHNEKMPATQTAVAQVTWNLAQTLTPDYHRRSGQYQLATKDTIAVNAQQLYKWVIQPIQAPLQQHNIEHLVVMPDGLLRDIPLTVLINPSTQTYLVESYGISVVPSLLALSTQPHGNQDQILAVGLTPPASRDNPYFPLTSAQAEIDQVSQLFRRWTTLTQHQFTWPRVKQHLASTQYSHLHIVTHGRFSATPQGTFLIDKDAKRLTLDDLERLLEPQNALDLLTLSACQTAQGDNRAALGLAGVAVQSGARNTLATLFIVPDQFAAHFMAQFYRALQSDLSPATALQETQKTYIHRSPSLWAPYVMVGRGSL